MNLNSYSADLHIHSCLSPCAELEMSPQNIAKRAANIGIDLIALCDHNSAENAEALIKAGKSMEITVIPGMEITSKEEVHMVGLFPSIEHARSAQKVVYENLSGINDDRVFGKQIAVNENDEILWFNDHLLIGATELSIEEVVSLIHECEGLAIASHVDREGFGIIGRLGFIPDELPLDAVELSKHASTEVKTVITNTDRCWPVIRSSDAHRLEDIGSAQTSFLFAEVSFKEINLALLGEDGRKIESIGLE